MKPILKDARNVDGRSLLLIALGFGLVLLVFPPWHEYSVTDDWAYYRSVEEVLAGRGFRPPDFIGPIIVSHIYWGALFAWLFGLSFTTLITANLVMSFVATVSFYLLLRQCQFSPERSLLGVALLCFNPLFLGFSYSFMTDLTFLALLLLASNCYLYALAGKGSEQPSGRTSLLWLLLGSVFASLAFLNRQFGVVLPLAATIWLLWAQRSGQPQLRGRTVGGSLLAIALLPLLTGLGYLLWRSGFGPTTVSIYQEENTRQWLAEPVIALLVRSGTVLAYMPILALMLPLLWPVRRHWLILYWLVLAGLSVYGLYAGGLTSSPFILVNSRPATPLNDALRWVGLPLAGWVLAAYSEGFYRWLRSLRRPPTALDFVCITAGLLLFGTWLVSAAVLPRYFLPLLPAMIAVGLYQLAQHPPLLARPRRWLSLWLVVLAVAGYSLIIQVDDNNYSEARWRVGRELVAQGVPLERLDNGFAWSGFYLYEPALQRFGRTDYAPVSYWPPAMLLDPEYVIALQTQTGYPGQYEVIARHSFFSPLSGFQQRELLVLRRQPATGR